MALHPEPLSLNSYIVNQKTSEVMQIPTSSHRRSNRSGVTQSTQNGSTSQFSLRPSFEPPQPKMISLGTEPGEDSFSSTSSETPSDSCAEQNFFDADLFCASTLPKMYPFKRPQSQTLQFVDFPSAQPVLEEPMVDMPTRPRNYSSFIMNHNSARDNESFYSDAVPITDTYQIDKAVLDVRENYSIQQNNNMTILPSRFAVDSSTRNLNGITSASKFADPTTRILTEDQSPQSGVKGRSNQTISKDDKAKKRWNKLSCVIRSISLIQKHEVTSIYGAKEIASAISNFQLRIHDGKFNLRKNSYRVEHTKDAFDLMRRIQVLSDCVKIGSEKHMVMMKKLLDNDPKKHILESHDPDHILNKRFSTGQTPMYTAAKNGNLNAIEMLVQYGANHLYPSHVNRAGSTKEIPLEAAVKWHHLAVIEFLLMNCEHSASVIKRCFKLTDSKAVKEILSKHLKLTQGKKSK